MCLLPEKPERFPGHSHARKLNNDQRKEPERHEQHWHRKSVLVGGHCVHQRIRCRTFSPVLCRQEQISKQSNSSNTTWKSPKSTTPNFVIYIQPPNCPNQIERDSREDILESGSRQTNTTCLLQVTASSPRVEVDSSLRTKHIILEAHESSVVLTIVQLAVCLYHTAS